VEEPYRVCFVCLGNICRSPTAEGIMAALVAEAGWSGRIEVHSAATSDWHTGKLPDDRARAEASRRGVELTSRACTFRPGDAGFYDLVLAMDASNRADLLARSDPAHHDRIRLVRQFDPDADGDLDVPDPWSGGDDGFRQVFDLLDSACRGLLASLVDTLGDLRGPALDPPSDGTAGSASP
jgi:protein-tyrosine phosphatase